MSNKDWEDLTLDEKREALERDEKTIFVDDLREFYAVEDCGGDVNFHMLGGDGFASLNPPEVRRLQEALTRRVAQYGVSQA